MSISEVDMEVEVYKKSKTQIYIVTYVARVCTLSCQKGT